LDVDPGNIDSIGARTAKIIFKRTKIETPIRSLPHSEYSRYLEGYDIINSHPKDLPFIEIVRAFEKTHLETLHDNMNRHIQYDTRQAKKPNINIPVIVCPYIDKGISLSRPDIFSLIKYQAKITPANVISVPDPGKAWFDKKWKEIMKFGLLTATQFNSSYEFEVVMPIVNLDQKIEFVTKKVNWLLEQDINAIGFKYASNFAPRLIRAIDIIRNHTEDEIRNLWVHFTHVGKQMKSLSQPHLAVLAQIDTISTRRILPKSIRYLMYAEKTPLKKDALWGVPQEPSRDTVRRQLEGFRGRSPRPPQGDLLERNLLAYLTDNEHIDAISSGSVCDCEFHQRCSDEKELKRYLGSNNRKSLLNIHDMDASTNEFLEIQRSIENDDLLNYFRSKERVLREKLEVSKRYKIDL